LTGVVVFCVCTVVDGICVVDIVDVTGCLVELSGRPVVPGFSVELSVLCVVTCFPVVVDGICVALVAVTGCLVELSGQPVVTGFSVELSVLLVVTCFPVVVDGICVAFVPVTGCLVERLEVVSFTVVLCAVDGICVTVVVVSGCSVVLMFGSPVVLCVVGQPCSSSPSGQSTYTSQTCSFLIHFSLLLHRHSVELLQGHLSSSSPNEQSL